MMNKHVDVSRREFMTRMSLLGSLAVACPAVALAERRQSIEKNVSVNGLPDWMDDPHWQTITQVQEVLFPAGDEVPGAADIGATIYLHDAIENPDADAEDKGFIFRGVGWLDGLTQERFDKTFLQLTGVQQETIISVIVKSRAGRNWVSMLLTYTLEALLADPVYGGNKNGAGWKWLEHQPGFPAPSADKTWDKLLQRRYRA
ncbi:MAG TPA: gluconate 2-dehydrogenase subunit 3 family protein [Gammaproteobacteria bacterium]|nr:gluconate 2-dehydrogenase subunit 3 family protein [Gammaproteobacteria bacterium]